ncbi:MAG: hypothetical protein IKL97_08225 [Eggerthellaceae bacterium]|nr:hypothetical protein [Eggerthellaceae bacterium]
MKNKKTLIIDIFIVVWFMIALAFLVFCVHVTVLEGLGTVDIGEAYPDIDPYNLPIYSFQGYSSLGMVPLVAPFMIPFILISLQTKRTRELLLFALLLITLISYNSSINATWAFLQEVSTEASPIGRYTTGIVYPVAYSIYTAFSLVLLEHLPSDE